MVGKTENRCRQVERFILADAVQILACILPSSKSIGRDDIAFGGERGDYAG
jgi:hypothetical protein